jgi:hypothetical protein
MTVAELEEDVRGYELAHREALRALDYQRAALDALRSRVGLLLSAGAIATSFLGGQALRTEANAWAWTAIVFFVVFGAVALRILWPRAEGAEGFTAVPSGMIAEFLEGETRHSLPKIYRELALHAEAAHDLNRDRHFGPLTWYFRAAISLLMAEIVLWVVALVSR